MRWLRIITRVGIWLLAAVGVTILVAVVVAPTVNGWVPLTILSGSMEPTYPVGSQVVVERVVGDAVNDLEVGDVITFLPEAESASAVTHRIVAKARRQDGTAVFTTRGDANNSDDPWALTDQQIRAKVRYHVPYVGYVATSLTPEKKDKGVTAVAVLLFGYADWQVLQGIRHRLRRDAGVQPARSGRHRQVPARSPSLNTLPRRSSQEQVRHRWRSTAAGSRAGPGRPAPAHNAMP